MRSPFSWRPLNIQMVPKLQLVLCFTAASQNHQAFSVEQQWARRQVPGKLADVYSEE